MSGQLLSAALAADEDFSSDSEARSVNGEGEKSVPEAISHTPLIPKVKKRKSSGSGGATAPKKPTMPSRNLEPAVGVDGLVQTIFVEGVCIPLWPQYRDVSTLNSFIRIGTQEDWLIQFMVASRKAVAQAKKNDETPKEKKNGRGISSNAYVTKWTKNSRKRVRPLEKPKGDRLTRLSVVK